MRDIELWIPYGPPAATFEWGGNQDLAEKADLRRHPSAEKISLINHISLGDSHNNKC